MILLLCLVAGVCNAADPIRPDPKLTPGCTTNVPIEILLRHGYTASPGVRHVPESVKRQCYREYGIENTQGEHEVDHLISLELGGCNGLENLWPQSYKTFQWNAHTKDKLENRLAAVLRRELATNGPAAATKLLHQFQQEIATDWIACYQRQFPTKK